VGAEAKQAVQSRLEKPERGQIMRKLKPLGGEETCTVESDVVNEGSVEIETE
jgi:hypothetical protein